jgi:hypothetical protein
VAVQQKLNSPFYGDRMIRKVEGGIAHQSQLLLDYWEYYKNYLNGSNEELMGKIMAFDPGAVLQRIELTPDQIAQDNNYDSMYKLRTIAEQVISSAGKGLSNSIQPDTLKELAALWWAARVIETSAGCSLRPTEENSPGRALVLRQFDHQQCRRIYSTRTYTELNLSLSHGEPLDITSKAWTLNYALGSRLERAKLFTRAIPILINQLNSGRLPSRAEIALIALEAHQSKIELSMNRSFTWTGLQDLSEAQRTEIERFINQAKLYFIQAAQKVMPNALIQPELHRTLLNVWLRLQNIIDLPEFLGNSNLP